jgi:hypothetical protein
VPPIVVFGTPIPVDGKSPTNTKDVIAAKGRPTVFDPEWMFLASSGTIVVAPNEEVLSFGHVVMGGIAMGIFGSGVNEADSKIPNLQRSITTLNDTLIFGPFRMDISN